jgi:transposase
MNILDWPSQPPDLNPIENLWSIMKNMVQKGNPKKLDELRIIILEIWEELD